MIYARTIQLVAKQIEAPDAKRTRAFIKMPSRMYEKMALLRISNILNAGYENGIGLFCSRRFSYFTFQSPFSHNSHI